MERETVRLLFGRPLKIWGIWSICVTLLSMLIIYQAVEIANARQTPINIIKMVCLIITMYIVVMNYIKYGVNLICVGMDIGYFFHITYAVSITILGIVCLFTMFHKPLFVLLLFFINLVAYCIVGLQVRSRMVKSCISEKEKQKLYKANSDTLKENVRDLIIYGIVLALAIVCMHYPEIISGLPFIEPSSPEELSGYIAGMATLHTFWSATHYRKEIDS